MNKITTATLVWLALTVSVEAAPFAKGDVAAGKKSYEQHKCNECHVSKLGGDGSAMYTRKDRKIKKAESLATQITACSVNLGLSLFEDEEENLGAYLNKNYYKFK
jgi:cytochrome c553